MSIQHNDVTTIYATNVNTALPQGISALLRCGIEEPSRNGGVLVAPGPVITSYSRPWERVLFNRERNANPFFHLMEALWMLAGRQDLEFPRYFNKRFGEYSDDGVNLPAAYGHRWRNYFGYDQLELVLDELRANPNSRRAVLAMWDGGNPWTDSSVEWTGDLQRVRSGTVDAPCNTHVYFDCRGGKLNMTVCCRSNDMLWGAYGANVVHFSVLQEYMAAALGVKMGAFRQISNNFHAYLGVYDRGALMRMETESEDLYLDHDLWLDERPHVHPLVSIDYRDWDAENRAFLTNPLTCPLTDPFLVTVAQPMYRAWHAHKTGAEMKEVYRLISMINAEDWWLACGNFIGKIHNARKQGKKDV